MSWLKDHAASVRAVAIIALGGLGLSACATRGYVDEQIATVNTRIDAVDARVADATQRADTALAEARTANQNAQGAAGEARTANQRIDQLDGRVQTLERQPARVPRG